jgi:4-aminobutyrate aminotransferase-like enzyme/Ser/Thr protein kinase RdoA (MazF antagonist)
MQLLEHAPRFSTQAAISLADKLYGIPATATPLPSERDQNFLLVTESADKFILKIANDLEARSLLEAQNQVLSHLESRVSFCPRVIPTLAGEDIAGIEFSAGVTNFVRLMTHLPGVPLAEVGQHSSALLQDLGSKLGQLDRALADFDHAALHRDFHWDLANGLKIIEAYSPLVADAATRAYVQQYSRIFARDFAPLLSKLRTGVIHGDANDYNVIVGDFGGEQKISGLIDFGDMVHSYVVGDLAVAIAYEILNKPDPLQVAAEIVAGYSSEYPLDDAGSEVLWGMVLMRLCMSVCLAAQQQGQRPDNEYLEISQRSIASSLPELMAIDSRKAADLFRKTAGRTAGPPGKSKTLSDRQRLLGRNLSVAYKNPIKIVRGEMQYLYDDAGTQYLDAYNNVAHVGHCHRRVVKAAQDQIALLNTNTRYLHDTINQYAEKLTATLPDPLSVCFFVNSGSEANELALRLARSHTKSRNLIVLDHAYHGNTTTLIDISPYKHDGPGGEGAGSFVHKVPLPDTYRGLYRDDDAGEKYAQIVTRLLQQLNNVSGFIAESMPSVAGQIILPDGYLSSVYTAVRAAGGVCIADEVQTGYGRFGTHFWGFESYGVVPDIVVLGKPIGNGHPIGAVVTTPEIAESFDNGMEFFSTFGGNTVSCAIGLAVLNVVLEEELQTHAQKVGGLMLRGLQELKTRHELIGDVRGSGFFIGVELVRDRETLEPATAEAEFIVNLVRDEGILIGTDGHLHNVLKIRPPMPFSDSDAHRLLATLDSVLYNPFGDPLSLLDLHKPQ